MADKTLYDVEQDADSALEDWLEDNPDADESEFEDALNELADGCVPVYNGDRLTVALSSLKLANTAPETVPESADACTILGVVIYEHVEQHLRDKFDEFKKERDDAKSDIDDALLMMNLPYGYTAIWEGPATETFSITLTRDSDGKIVLTHATVRNDGEQDTETTDLKDAIREIEEAANNDLRTVLDAAIKHIAEVLPEGYQLTARNTISDSPGYFQLVLKDGSGTEVIRESSDMKSLDNDLARIRVLALNDEDTTNH